MEHQRTEPYLNNRQEKSLLRAASAAIKAEFPNPHGRGCPEPGSIRNLAYRRIPLGETGNLVDHVATCAPCFDAYRQYRRQLRLTRAGAPILLIGVCLLAVALAWPLVVSRSAHRKQSIAKGAAIPILQATVDYREFSATRSPTANIPKGFIPHLPLGVLDLVVLLPLGVEDGDYSIELGTPGGQVLRTATGTAKSGGDCEVLTTRIDLGGLTTGEYFIAVRGGNASGQTYPLVLEQFR